MQLINSIFSWMMKKRFHQIELFMKFPNEVQQELILKHLQDTKNTKFAKQYDFLSIKSVEEFQRRVPLVHYEDLEPYITQMRNGEADVLWNGKTKWFAKSSGTTNAKSKFIPITEDSIQHNHFKAGKDMLSIYCHNNPDSQIFTGKSFRLGGSHQILESKDSFYGDLSAILIENYPFWADFISTPTKKVSLIDDWSIKMGAIIQEVKNENVTNMAGVPSWMLIVLKQLLTENKQETLKTIWPYLEVFFHGGINFTPYKRQYQELIGGGINYFEIYNASEGFLALQSENNSSDLLLMLDYGIFYEFIPMSEFHNENRRTLTLDEVELRINYAVVISTNGGLWRYIIGDTVKFTSLSPYKVKVTGRTKHYINAFGEELMIENADEALEKACLKTGAKIKEYTAGPIFMNSESKGAHEWIIEFEKQPNNQEEFNRILDEQLQNLNSDYEAKRFSNMTLDFPKIHIAKNDLFFNWMKNRGRLGGQNKIPRLANDRVFLDELLPLNKEMKL